MALTAVRHRWRSIVLAVFVLAVAVVVAAQTPVPSQSGNEQQVKTAQQQMLKAALGGNKDELSRFLADDLSWIDLDGKVFDKQAMLNRPAVATDANVRVNNDVATVTVQVTGFNKEGFAQPPERQTRIFAKRNGKWQQVAAIATIIGE
ncbi:MAG: nuclear transport factor 2 family protein [Bacteroidales bacterium]